MYCRVYTQFIYVCKNVYYVFKSVPQLGLYWWVCKPILESPCTNKPICTNKNYDLRGAREILALPTPPIVAALLQMYCSGVFFFFNVNNKLSNTMSYKVKVKVKVIFLWFALNNKYFLKDELIKNNCNIIVGTKDRHYQLISTDQVGNSG